MIETPSRQDIWKMFDAISSSYDRTNRMMTYGLDCYWRKKMAALLPAFPSIELLDIATGTGDQLFFLMQRAPQIRRAMGVDLAEKMLLLAQQKNVTKPFRDRLSFLKADAIALPFQDNSFECVTISFGIRNVIDVDKALEEMQRVLKPGGRALILEATLPTNPLLKKAHLFYLRYLMPAIGALLSKNKSAYRYLNETIETFPAGDAFCQKMHSAGFHNTAFHPLTAGSVTIYQGDKG